MPVEPDEPCRMIRAGIGFIISCFIKEDLRRQKMELALAGRGLYFLKILIQTSLQHH